MARVYDIYFTFLDSMSWILAKNSSKDIALAGSDSNMPANTGVKRSLRPLKIKMTELQENSMFANAVLPA